jgi:hypothetical protein
MERRYVLDYGACTIEEQHTFIYSRSGRPTAKRTQRFLIEWLRRLDNTATFRFFDLPPELRNQVYDYLLIVPETPQARRFPQILRTCKQARAEGESILYHDSHVVLRIRRNRVTVDRGIPMPVSIRTALPGKSGKFIHAA